MRSKLAFLPLVLTALAGPAAAQDAARPAKVSTCVLCHGRDGQGTAPNVPNLAGQSAVYTIEQLEAFRDGRRQNEEMSIVAKDLTDADIRALAEYYEALPCGC